MEMIGAAINSAGILAGGIGALMAGKTLPARLQESARLALGAATVWLGLQLTWKSLNGTPRQVLKELALALVAMTLGKLAGRMLGLQHASNQLGQYAAREMGSNSRSDGKGEGFAVATGLFCLAPLAFLASLHEGLNTFSPVFVVKAAVDGLAAMAFCLKFGAGSLVSALPVLAFEGVMIRAAALLEPWLRSQPQPLVDSINAVDGLLVFSVALLILEIRKVRVADYLPALVVAPLLTHWLW